MFLEATYGWVQNQLGSMIITPVSNRFTAGLGGLPLLYNDAGLIDPRYYENKPLAASGTPYFADGRILLPPTFAFGNRVANAPPSLGFPGFMNINRTQDFSISLTKIAGRHTLKAGFYINHSYKAQNLGAGGGSSFQGAISFANDAANPLDTGFGFANAALGIFTSYQQQSKFVEGSFLYDQVDWYVQDNWKVNSKLTLDYGLRFVNQRPQYDQYLQASNFFPERWSAAAAPTLYVAGCVNNANPCSGTNRQARNPLTNQLLGPNTTLVIGQIVPNSGDAMNGIRVAGDGIAKGNYEWPTIGYAPRFGVAYDLTGAQKFIVRGGAGLFFDRPNGNSVFSQVGNPPFSTSTTVRYSQLQNIESGGLATQGPPAMIVFKYDSELPSSYQWNVGMQFALPWSFTADISYVGQHGFNLLQNVDINAVDMGTAFTGAAQDPTVTVSATPGGSALSVDLLRPYRGVGAIQQNWGIGDNTYHSIQTSFNRRFRNGLSGGLNYTLGLSNTGTAGNPVRLQHNVADGSYVIRADQAESDELLKDLGLQRHIIKGNMVWDLPDLSGGGGARRVIAAVVNDWQLSGILTAGTGAPYSVGFSYAGGAVGNAAGGTNANGTGNQNLTGSPSYAPRILIAGDPGSGCSDNQYAQFSTTAFAVPVASATNPSLGLESGQNYLHGCFDKTIDLALARNFRLGGSRTLQFRLEAFNAFNTVVYNGRNTTLQVTSPVNLTQSNPQYDASGNLVQTRLQPQNAGFGAATGAQAMRSMQAQIRFQF
jgi:hypothetical protein